MQHSACHTLCPCCGKPELPHTPELCPDNITVRLSTHQIPLPHRVTAQHKAGLAASPTNQSCAGSSRRITGLKSAWPSHVQDCPAPELPAPNPAEPHCSPANSSSWHRAGTEPSKSPEGVGLPACCHPLLPTPLQCPMPPPPPRTRQPPLPPKSRPRDSITLHIEQAFYRWARSETERAASAISSPTEPPLFPSTLQSPWHHTPLPGTERVRLAAQLLRTREPAEQ